MRNAEKWLPSGKNFSGISVQPSAKWCRTTCETFPRYGKVHKQSQSQFSAWNPLRTPEAAAMDCSRFGAWTGEQMGIAVSGTWHWRNLGFFVFFFLYKLSYPQTQLVCEYDSQPGIFHSCASLLSGMQILLARLMSSDSCAALPSSNWVSDTCAIHLKALGCTGVIGLVGGLSGFTAVTGDWGGQILSSLLAVGMHAMAISLAVETSLESAG